MEYLIYLVEDSSKLNRLLTTHLQAEGWQVRSFVNGLEAKNEIHLRPHLWVLDIMLPKVNGYDLLKEIKEEDPGTPVIFISALHTGSERILGLALGSEDYIPKPFLPRELVLRSRRVLERVYRTDFSQTNAAQLPTYILPPYMIYSHNKMVTKNGIEIKLSPQEINLLLLFLKHSEDILNRESILKEVWGENYYASDRIVDVLVSSIRKKMPDINIVTYYGQGYRLIMQ